MRLVVFSLFPTFTEYGSTTSQLSHKEFTAHQQGQLHAAAGTILRTKACHRKNPPTSSVDPSIGAELGHKFSVQVQNGFRQALRDPQPMEGAENRIISAQIR